MSKSLSFTAKVWLRPGTHSAGSGQVAGAWHFVTVPKSLAERAKASARRRARNGLIRIRARVGKTEWETSLLFSAGGGPAFGRGKQHCLIALKKSVRKAEGIMRGDEVKISFVLI